MGILNGKIAIVTGGTSGIGKRITEIFIDEGAKVVAAARREEEGKQLEAGTGANFIRTDVSDALQVRAMIDFTIAKFGRIDCLVNNAAVPSPMASVVDVDMDNFEQVMAINVRGVLLGMKLVVPHMIAQQQGSIINVSSIGAFRAGGISAHTYAASKAAVTQLTRSVATELGRSGIRVNSISPGAIVTGIFAKNAGVDGSSADKVLSVVAEEFATKLPVTRAGITDDIANAASFLASDKASFIHGHDLVVDGGFTLTGYGWKEGIDFRSTMIGRIKETVAQLNG